MSAPAPQPIDLVEAVQRFCEQHDFSKSKFGEQALNDPSFVADLEAGREPRRKTVARVLQFIERHKEPGAAA